MKLQLPNGPHPLVRLDFKHPEWNKSFMYDTPIGDEIVFIHKQLPDGINEDDIVVESVFFSNANKPVTNPKTLSHQVEPLKSIDPIDNQFFISPPMVEEPAKEPPKLKPKPSHLRK